MMNCNKSIGNSRFWFLSVFSLILLVVQSSFAFKPPKRPNIVFILADDLGYADVGFNGAVDIVTPNLDKLVANGTMFTSAYVAHSFCGPSRAGLLTGRYPHSIGSQFNLKQDSKKGIDTNEVFFSKVLQDANYKTALIGKWHLGEEHQYHPNERGFDYFYGFLGGGHNYFTSQYLDAHANGNKWDYNRPLRENLELADEPRDVYLTDWFSQKGVEYINKSEEQDEDPFLLFMSYNAPHSILEAKEEDKKTLEEKPYSFKYKDDRRQIYAAMVYALDRGVGELVAALKKNGEFENTLIVFLSDNGGRTDKVGMATNTPLRGGKGDTFEGGFRVPMFLHWPNKIPAGKVYDYPVSSLDFYPMFAALAGTEIPKNKVIDGIDILEAVVKNKNARKGKSIFAMRHTATNNRVGVRKDQWKLYSSGNGKWSLFNISKDIGETKNLSASHKDVVKEMVQEAHEWSKTHIQPEFFDNGKLEKAWKSNGMPNFSKTFPTQSVVSDIWNDEVNSGYLYQNPMNNNEFLLGFNSSVTEEVSVHLFDENGSLMQAEQNIVSSNKNQFGFSIDSEISEGNYIVRVMSGKIEFTKKISIEKGI